MTRDGARTADPFPPPGERPARILVLCRPILGDMVLAGPVFRSLRAWQPSARITALCLEGRQDFLAFASEADEIVEMPRPGPDAGGSYAARWLALAWKLRRWRFDLVYDLMQTDRSSLLCGVIGARRRVGFVKGKRRLRHRVYTDTAPWTDGDDVPDHAVDLYLRPLVQVGMPVATRSVALELRAEDAVAARSRLSSLLDDGSRPLVICHPGASSANKCWPLEGFAALCDELQAELGVRVLLLGGPAEQESLVLLRSLMRTEPAVIEGALPMRQLAAVMAEADLFFGHDSGPMHVAAAVGTPVVALFGASSPAQWRPLGQGHTLVRPGMPCSGCPFPHLCNPPNPYQTYCVRRITRDEVRGALHRSLAKLTSIDR